jgi:hypothetical protein
LIQALLDDPACACNGGLTDHPRRQRCCPPCILPCSESRPCKLQRTPPAMLRRCQRELHTDGCSERIMFRPKLTALVQPFPFQECACCTPACATMAQLVVGCRVRIQGLVGAPQHNGKEGVLVSFIESTQRWSVEVGEPELLAVKPANLVFVTMPDAPKRQDARKPRSRPGAQGESPVLRTYASTVGTYAILLLPGFRPSAVMAALVSTNMQLPHPPQRPLHLPRLQLKRSWLCAAVTSSRHQQEFTVSCLLCRLLQ